MLLAFCLFKYSPYGGLGRDFWRIAKACAQRGHHIQIFTMEWEGPVPQERNISITVTPIFALTNHARAKKFSEKICQIIHQQIPQFDVVIGFNRLAGLDLYYAADPCYQTEMQKRQETWMRFLPRNQIYLQLEMLVFSKESPTKILLLNPEHQKDFESYYQTQTYRFIPLSPGIGKDRKRPTDQFSLRSALRKSMRILPEDNVLLLVGSNFKLKGVDRAIQALAALPEPLKHSTYLWVVGKGNASNMQQLAYDLGLYSQITFWGAKDDIVNFYAAADYLIHPARQETAGMVLIEALEAHLPVIVSSNCGYATYIARANAGQLIPEPFSQSDFNHQLKNILLDKNKNLIYRENAKQYTASHDHFHLAEDVTKQIELIGKIHNDV